jgi:hypothetical protein
MVEKPCNESGNQTKTKRKVRYEEVGRPLAPHVRKEGSKGMKRGLVARE